MVALILIQCQNTEKEIRQILSFFHIVKHPKDLPNEVVGKGVETSRMQASGWSNIYNQEEIAFSDVVTKYGSG